MAEEVAITLLLGPAIALGLVIGIYEMLIIHRDVQVATHRFGHSIHALLLSVFFTFCSMNAEFVLSIVPQLQTIPVLGWPLGLQIAIGLVAAIKIHAVSRAIKTTGMNAAGLGETWFHSLLIGGLITASPYLYPFVEPLIPNWMKF